ncbi:hypothetical protein F5X68DRAFT_240428 [Plectosphaerella plurivora]|uniref:Uncharacterized protein n=1 Tax=Plectosphaerella plurivora TaxID=936078 RepID=A0A9P9AA92_9PEZI|nr:hypothetical protein F5X68DRAFT_240428 [Plectosphaerella plurivora]
MENSVGSKEQRPHAHQGPDNPRGQTPNGKKPSKGAKKRAASRRGRVISPSQAGDPRGASQNSGGVKLDPAPTQNGKASTTSQQADASVASPRASEGADTSRQSQRHDLARGVQETAEDTAAAKAATLPLNDAVDEPLSNDGVVDSVVSKVPHTTEETAVATDTQHPSSEPRGPGHSSGPVVTPALVDKLAAGNLVSDLRTNLPFSMELSKFLDIGRDLNTLLRPDAIAALYLEARELGRLSRQFSNIAETALIMRFVRMAGPPEPQLRGVVGRLRKEIAAISRAVETEENYPDYLWMTAWECRRQASESSGTLHLEKLLKAEEVPPMSASEWCKEYHIHPVEVEEDIQDDSPPKTPKQLQESWVDFWTRIILKCPGGPTLFQPTQFGPSPSSDVSCMFPFSTDLPRYLYRVVDPTTLDGEIPEVAASVMWLSERGHPDQVDASIDLLSQDTFVAADKLRRHLTNSSLDGEDNDNLLSWSSSLPYALQTAVYRGVQRSCADTDVYVCVVDTTKFPTGQFVRDRWLLKAYRDTAVARAERRWFDSRLDDQTSYHGEFLSQGKVGLKGRSSICTLQALMDAGLKDMYPDLFSFPTSSTTRQDCDDRFTELRRDWATRCKSTTEDIEHALNIAQNFGPPVDQMDVAIQLMAFKNRMIYKKSRPNDIVERVRVDDPVETRRFQDWAPMITSAARQQGNRAALGKLFWLTPKSLKDRYRQTKAQE